MYSMIINESMDQTNRFRASTGNWLETGKGRDTKEMVDVGNLYIPLTYKNQGHQGPLYL